MRSKIFFLLTLITAVSSIVSGVILLFQGLLHFLRGVEIDLIWCIVFLASFILFWVILYIDEIMDVKGEVKSGGVNFYRDKDHLVEVNKDNDKRGCCGSCEKCGRCAER